MGPFQRITLTAISALFIMGCNTLDLTVNFTQIQGLTPGAPVVLDHTTIGRVKEILPRANDVYPTSVEIDSKFKSLVTENSTFTLVPEYLDKDSTTAPRTIIMVAKSAAGGAILNDGAVVNGSEPPVLPEISDLLKKFSTGFESFKERIGRIPESQEYKGFEQSVDELARRMQESSKEVQEHIKNEILPKLEQEFEALKKKMGDQWSKDPETRQELEPLEKKLNNLKEI